MKTILLFEASVTPASRRAFDGVNRYAKTARWNVRVIEYSLAAARRTHGKSDKLPAIGEILELWNPDGVIVECAGRPSELPPAAFGKLPLVLLDCDPSTVGKGIAGVSTDAASIAKAAVRELLPLGLAELAYVPYTEDTIWSRRRGEAFAEFAGKSGLNCRQLNVPKHRINAVSLVAELIPQVISLHRPCGVFAANDEIARAVVSACEQAGITVPNDIAVIGADNDESICENGVITLSSVRVGFEAAGFEAAQLLDAKMADRRRKIESVSVGSADVVRRSSTRRLPSADTRVMKALEYIRRNAYSGITPLDVVREMECSRRLADLRFTGAMGHTILDEIHAVRIERVKELLLNPETEISSLPARCGYASLSDLCRVFKKRTGETLLSWRRAQAE